MTDRMHSREGWNPLVIAEGTIWLREAETGEDVNLEQFEIDAHARGTVANIETLAASDCECAASWFPGSFAPCDGPYGIQACDGCTAHGDDFDTAYALAAHLQGLTGRTFAVWYEAEPVIFASKTPRDLNRDPYPFESDGERISRALYLSYAPAYRKAAWFEAPRPEFDHAQHNEPNRILVAFRMIDAGRNEYADWLRDFDEHPAFWTRGHGDPSALYPQYTPAEVHHARRVLTRLANLTEQETHA